MKIMMNQDIMKTMSSLGNQELVEVQVQQVTLVETICTDQDTILNLEETLPGMVETIEDREGKITALIGARVETEGEGQVLTEPICMAMKRNREGAARRFLAWGSPR